MMKKKNPETEGNHEEKHTETTENKLNTNKETAGEVKNEEQIPADEAGKAPTEGDSPAKEEPDKVIPAEKQAEEKLAEMQDRYLRLSAEFDNYRKRTLKEKMEITKFAGEDILMRLLPFMDDYERALKSIQATDDFKSIREGIELIYGKLSDFLRFEGLKEIDSLNKEFSVDLHDAVATMPVEEEDKKGKVVEVVAKGYYFKDKVLRHAKVVVGE